jgi:hypothetical protein
MTLTATTGTYTNPQTLGQYPNARIEYGGDRNDSLNKRFRFKFKLLSENEDEISRIFWIFKGDTPSGNTIQNHGLIISGGTSGSTQVMDFIDFTLADGDYDYSGHTISEYPVLSYDDIDTYFILGNKKDKVGLPAGQYPKKLVKWLLLNTVPLNGQFLKEQFSW